MRREELINGRTASFLSRSRFPSRVLYCVLLMTPSHAWALAPFQSPREFGMPRVSPGIAVYILHKQGTAAHVNLWSLSACQRHTFSRANFGDQWRLGGIGHFSLYGCPTCLPTTSNSPFCLIQGWAQADQPSHFHSISLGDLGDHTQPGFFFLQWH